MINTKELIHKNQPYIFLFLDLILNFFNYFFHIFVAWYLIPKEYGVLNSLLSIASILFVVGISVQLLTSKVIANKNSNISLDNILSLSVMTFPIIALVFIFTVSSITKLTNSSGISVFLLILIFVINIFLCLLRGVFQGETRFLMINFSMYTEVITKMILIFILLPIFKNIESAMVAILLGMLVSLIYAIYQNKKRLSEIKITKINYRKTGTELLLIIFSNVFLYYFTSVDMVWVNKKLVNDAGIYAVVLRLSQLISFAYLSLFTILNPWMSSKVSNKEDFKKSLKNYSILFSFINVIIILSYIFIIPNLVPHIFGKVYVGAVKYLPYEAIAYVLLAMSFFMVNVFIQLGLKNHLIILLVTSLLLTFLYMTNMKDIFSVIIIQIVSYIIMFTALLSTLVYKLRR